MSMQTPLLPGPRGWQPGHRLPDFEPEGSPGLNPMYRRVPAALRILNPKTLPYLGMSSEDETYEAVRFWMEPRRKQVIHLPIIEENVPKPAVRLHKWLNMPQNRAVRSWWKWRYSWRSPREFRGYNRTIQDARLLWVDPWEVAHFRLPDDISCDPEVVLFQAWCQGVQREQLPPGHFMSIGFQASIRNGLIKFSRSPWVRFAQAAPFMQPVGISFPPHSYFDSSLRLEYLLRNPFHATQPEMEYITASPMFVSALREAREERRVVRGQHKKREYALPNGNWYAGGSIGQSLGGYFRRGYFESPRLRSRDA